MGLYWNRGWVAHDDGMLAQSADRVLHGELPHRDFDEVYTGGLNYLHALGFRAFGENLVSIRRVLFVFFALWVPAVYYCALRFASPVASGIFALLAVAWSVPNYPASMPSWYNLFFATFGLAALLRYLEVRAVHWLFAAGISAGCSFLIKVSGLYFIGAVLLFFLFLEQSRAEPQTPSNPSPSSRWTLYRAALDICVFAFVMVLILLIRRLADFSEVYFFVLPGAALGVVLLGRASSGGSLSTMARLRALLGLAVPFLAGIAIPVAVFLAPYVFSHSLDKFYRGVFIVPFVRVTKALFPPPSPIDLAAVLPLLSLVAIGWYCRFQKPLIAGAAVSAPLAVALFLAPQNVTTYQLVFNSLYTLMPVAVIGGAIVLSRSQRTWCFGEFDRAKLFLVLSVAALCSLIQFPYSSPTYFSYVSPLVLLAVLAISSAFSNFPKLPQALLAIFYLLFMMLYVTPSLSLDSMAKIYILPYPMVKLDTPRAGGLEVAFTDQSLYDNVVEFVRRKSNGQTIYAGPDSPEIYFLVGSKNPTRMIFDFLEDPSTETSRVLSAIDRSKINIVVINRKPGASGPLPQDLTAELRERFPESKNIGKFEVRWRN